MEANEVPEKIYIANNVFPTHVDWDGSPINTKRIDDSDIEYTRADKIAKEDIIKFFTSQKCDSCLFKKECNKLYDVTRMHSTNPQTICDGILDNVLFE